MGRGANNELSVLYGDRQPVPGRQPVVPPTPAPVPAAPASVPDNPPPVASSPRQNLDPEGFDLNQTQCIKCGATDRLHRHQSGNTRELLCDVCFELDGGEALCEDYCALDIDHVGPCWSEG